VHLLSKLACGGHDHRERSIFIHTKVLFTGDLGQVHLQQERTDAGAMTRVTAADTTNKVAVCAHRQAVPARE
jgi:hypothetical protein